MFQIRVLRILDREFASEVLLVRLSFENLIAMVEYLQNLALSSREVSLFIQNGVVWLRLDDVVQFSVVVTCSLVPGVRSDDLFAMLVRVTQLLDGLMELASNIRTLFLLLCLESTF